MNISIVKNAPEAVTNEDITDLHPRLWEAQSLCRMLYDYALLYVNRETEDLEQIKCDIQHTARVVDRLIEDVHEAINDLDAKTIGAGRAAAADAMAGLI